MNGEALDGALRDLAAQVVFPPTPAMASRVERRIAARPRTRARWRPALLAAALATLLAAAAVAAAVLGLPGLRIVFTEELPSVSAEGRPLGRTFELGERMTLEAAAGAADIEVAWPQTLGEPDETYVSADGEMLTHVYAVSNELPALARTDIGLLVMLIDGSVDEAHVEKLVLQTGGSVTPTSVAGADGYWIEGAPHVMRYEDPSGREGQVRSRLVGDVLVWERDGVLYRIESALGREATVRIAESVAGR